MELSALYVFAACAIIASTYGKSTRDIYLQKKAVLQDGYAMYHIKTSNDAKMTHKNESLPYPRHASCSVEWTFGVDCIEVSTRLVNQIKLWSGPENCKDGGEKCLYKLKSVNKRKLVGNHATPVAMYIDNFIFRFRTTDYGCQSKSYSYSTVKYAFIDYGTNYCNLFNLIDGSGLNKEPSFSETTRDKICTQYTTADCDVY